MHICLGFNGNMRHNINMAPVYMRTSNTVMALRGYMAQGLRWSHIPLISSWHPIPKAAKPKDITKVSVALTAYIHCC